MNIPAMIRYGWCYVLWCLLLTALPAAAQFTESSFYSITGATALTRDRNNNIYMVSYNDSGQKFLVWKYPGGNANMATIIYVSPQRQLSGYDLYPWGLAVNSTGDVFVTSTQSDVNGEILKIPFDGTSYGSAVRIRNGEQYLSLAFDQQDNLLTMEFDMMAGKAKLMRYPANDLSGAAGQTLVNNLENQSEGIYPWGLAVDKDNTIYYNTGPNTMGQSYLKQWKNGTISTIINGNFTALACDDYGSLYAMEVNMAGSTTNSSIRKFTFGNNTSVDWIYGMTKSNTWDMYTLGLTVNGNGSKVYFNQQFPAGVSLLTASPITIKEMSAQNPTLTNAQTVNYKVGFNETRVDMPAIDAFSLITTGGITGAAITKVTRDFSNYNYFYVEVNTGTGDGTLALSMSGGRPNPVNNPGFNAQVYTIDKTAPVITWVTKPALTTTSTTAAFEVSVNETGSTVTATLDGAPVTLASDGKCQLTGLSMGQHTFEVTAKDGAGNTKTAQYQWSVITAITSIGVPGNNYYVAGSSLNFTVTYSSPVTVNAIPPNIPLIPITIGNITQNAFYTAGTGTNTLVFSYTVRLGDEAMDGIVPGSAIELNNGNILDPGNQRAQLTLDNMPATGGIKVHTAIPAVTLTSAAPATVNGPFTVDIAFSEDVTELLVEQILVGGATLSNFVKTDAQHYKVLVTPTKDGGINISVPTNAVKNVANTPNSVSGPFYRTADITAPQVLRVDVPANGYYNANSDLLFDVVFNEAVALNTTAGIPYINVTVGSQIKQAVYQSTVSPTTLRFGYKVASGDDDNDGISIGTMNLNNATIRDLAGNIADITLKNIGSTTGVLVNTQLPTVTLSMSGPVKVNNAFTVTATFGEKVTGLLLSSMVVSGNVSLSNLATSDNITYTFLVTPGVLDGACTVYMPAGAAKSARTGNGNQVSNTLNFTVDVTPPAVSSVTAPVNKIYGIGKELAFSVIFSEPVTVTGTPSFDLTIGAKTVQANYTSSTNDKTLVFVYTVQDGDIDLDGVTVGPRINLNGGAIKDEVGNAALLALNNVASTTGVKVDTRGATVTLRTSAVSPVGSAFTVTAEFSEKVSTLSAADFSVTNGNISTPQTTDNITFTVLVTPVTDGTVSISLPAGKVTNAIGNGNNASNILSLIYDTNPPQTTSVVVPGSKAYAIGQQLNFKVSFNEPVVVTGTPTLPVTIGSKAVQATYQGVIGGNTLSFTYEVQPGEMAPNGIQLSGPIQLNGSTIKDAAGNAADLTLHNIPSTTGIIVNTGTPEVTLSAPVYLTNKAFEVTISFTEPVDNLDLNKIVVSTGSASNLVKVDDRTYTATITPGTDGIGNVVVSAGAAINNAGTGNKAADPLPYFYDGTRPFVMGVTAPAPGNYKIGDVLTFKLNFNENVRVSGTPFLPVTLGTAQVKAVYAGGSGMADLTFSYTVQPGDMAPGGIGLTNPINLDGGTIIDQAENDARLTLNGVPATAGIKVSGQEPAVTLSTSASSPVMGAFTVTAIFSEKVTGLTASDFVVTGGNAGSLQTADNTTYTVLITPTTEGTISISLSAGKAMNNAGNGNKASNVITLQADMTPPTVILATASPARTNTSFMVQLTFNEEMKNFSATALQVNNGTAGPLQTTDNVHYNTLITPVADGSVTVQLPAGAAFDKAGNGNQVSNSISVVSDATAPVIAQQAIEVYDNSPAGALAGQMTATDASGVIQDWKLVTDGSGGALSLDANGRVTVKDNALLRTLAGKTIALRVTVSDGLNTSVAATVSVKVLVSFVNKPPVMNPVADVQLCATTAPQKIQLTGVSPVEADQHYTIKVTANQPYFDVLTADVATNTVRYQLKPGVSSGTAAITVTLQDDGGTDNGGKDSFSQTFYLTVNPLPLITISSDKGNAVSKGDLVTLTAEGAIAYSWAPAAGVTGELQQASLRVRPQDNATYTVTGTNAAGCSASAAITIAATTDYKLDATNMLTPNGDGINDRWVIRNLDSYPDNEVKIFDRSGRIVYQRRNYSNDWDGTLNGHPLAEGTYYYVLTVNGSTRVWKGFITIIRADQ
ncbi:Ig-like domain-containing protein [Chitinophaga qingshengii]|uniref:Gliding motility-associated C-terminal domain-containing protein n=1 Tax=Chitinophaga qingshengii TaxID=1569794 RepID=A0ABR7TH03_9BACT|nr:Ig-like domain-containing protein [Chitinophaga qingshengii]MBC9929208.1 gliding motility-associated C-terminal domain-containing protein [Chitinophaga qingshengii]